MPNTPMTRVRSLVGDIESEYDEYDRDADLEVSKRREGWLEPSW
ncbi:hypothetical protein DEJ13_00815 [Curtobacterium sp. MCLR17_007]|nr:MULTISPECIES: hypothetical protein [unclassified Curtobacterium]WIB60397.1 hypothetical protein DEJ13_00815 [Curtobacterium sp. MCLR17_007]